MGKRVIPVLVGGASVPRAETLPELIRMLARRNAVGLRPERFKADCQGLVTALREQLAAAEAERNARTEAERKAAEAARRQAEAEAAARAVEAERRGRAQALAGMTPEQIAKAEELANWDFIKDGSDAQEFRDHLARFPNGVVERNARAKLEALIWDSIINADADDIWVGERLAAFQTEFPDGKHAAEAKAMRAKNALKAKEAVDALKRMAAEKDAWAEASSTNTLAAYKEFLEAWPEGEHAPAAMARISELRAAEGNPSTRKAIVGSLILVALLCLGFVLAQEVELRQAQQTPKLKVELSRSALAKAKVEEPEPEIPIVPSSDPEAEIRIKPMKVEASPGTTLSHPVETTRKPSKLSLAELQNRYGWVEEQSNRWYLLKGMRAAGLAYKRVTLARGSLISNCEEACQNDSSRCVAIVWSDASVDNKVTTETDAKAVATDAKQVCRTYSAAIAGMVDVPCEKPICGLLDTQSIIHSYQDKNSTIGFLK